MNKGSSQFGGLSRLFYLGLVLVFSIFYLIRFLRHGATVPQVLRLRERHGE